MTSGNVPLPAPRRDLPFLTGRYSVAPGLSQLGADRAIELDDQTPAYLAEKRRLLALQPHEHLCFDRFDPKVRDAVTAALIHRLDHDWPGYRQGQSHFESICAHIPEDVAVIRRLGGEAWTCAMHVCFPNGWAPREKIGLDFATTHAPVPGMNTARRQAEAMTDLMIRAEAGLQRYVWGLRTDAVLDHRPEVPSPRWSPERPDLFVRVERQVILGLPRVEAAIFLIRTYLTPVTELPVHAIEPLAAAIETMSAASAEYKGFAGQTDAVAAYLRSMR